MPNFAQMGLCYKSQLARCKARLVFLKLFNKTNPRPWIATQLEIPLSRLLARCKAWHWHLVPKLLNKIKSRLLPNLHLCPKRSKPKRRKPRYDEIEKDWND